MTYSIFLLNSYFGFQDANLRIMFCIIFFEIVGWYWFLGEDEKSGFLCRDITLIISIQKRRLFAMS